MPLIQIQNMRGLVPLFLECMLEWAGWLVHGWLGSDAPASLRKRLPRGHQILHMREKEKG
jgi:hypothetical protein